MASLRLRFLGPVALVSLCLAALCAGTAMSLLSRQANISKVLRENVASRRAATELEECLRDLIALLGDRVDAVSSLHERAAEHLRSIRKQADQAEEREIADRLEESFGNYLARWRALPPVGKPGHEVGIREAARLLEGELLRTCQEFEQYNDGRIEESTTSHERVLRQLAWGMGGVGLLGGVAGLVLGFGVARWLSQSIRRLQVQIRDAAWKLDHLPEIVLTGEGDFRGLHEQVERLTTSIERVVGRLRQREHEVLRAEQLAAVGQLAAGVGHELRNPLTSIKMLVQMGLEDQAVGLPPDDLRVIEQEIRRMERSLQGFLDFARPPRPDQRAVDVSDSLRSARDLVRGRAEKQRVTLVLDSPPEGLLITADGPQVQQVLVNLILNGLDAMPTGGTLELKARRLDRDPSRGAGDTPRVELTVRDTGPGISPEMTARLFQPFASTKERGVGLGLVISRRIAEDHGGTLTGANSPTGGAVFTVVLPTTPPAAAE